MTIGLDLIARVQEARRAFAIHTEVVEEMHRGFQVSIAEALKAATDAGIERLAAETALREAILAEFKATGNKQPAPGCGVRVGSRLDYSATQAFEWAMAHSLALKVDKVAFEKIAKAQKLPFVIYTDEATATIAQDLEKVLKEP